MLQQLGIGDGIKQFGMFLEDDRFQGAEMSVDHFRRLFDDLTDEVQQPHESSGQLVREHFPIGFRRLAKRAGPGEMNHQSASYSIGFVVNRARKFMLFKMIKYGLQNMLLCSKNSEISS